MESEKLEIDEYLYSSQLATWGFDTQENIMKMKVFVLGITGVGIQVAKNLVMMSFKEVCIYDETLVSVQDIGRNFLLNKNQIGKFTRAEASLQSLQQLNPNCTVRVSNDKSIHYISNNFDCVVIIDEYDINFLTKLNAQCRQNKVGFVMGGCLGLYGFTFVDFGQQHKVYDTNGEEPKIIHIWNITREECGVVELYEEKKIDLQVGDVVSFKEVEGMTQINGRQYTIMSVSTHPYIRSFTIGDTRNFQQYKKGGIATEVKVPIQMPFKSLLESLQFPYGHGETMMPFTTFDILDLPQQLHLTLLGVYDFYFRHKRLPRVLNEEDANEMLELVKSSKISGLKSMKDGCERFEVSGIDENMVLNTAKYAQTQISPVCTFWGGIIAQEVVKLTGKYKPLKQWLHHEFFSCLPNEEKITKTLDFQDRYSDYVVLFGDEFVKKCEQSKLLVAGANDTGNEMIKMLAMMGMSMKDKSITYVSDDAKIKAENMTSHSLFRKQHIGQSKSQIACKKGQEINEASNFRSMNFEISRQRQETLNDDFWDQIDFVISTVDSIKKTTYIDEQCVWYEKALFVCNTKGLMSNSQVVLPFKTLSYSDVEHEVHCTFDRSTMVNFTCLIDHAIEWARQKFYTYFLQPGQMLKEFYENRKGFFENLNKYRHARKRLLQLLKKCLIVNQSRLYENCLEIVLGFFNQEFDDSIQQLLFHFPHDYVDQNSRRSFWSGLKRCPEVIQFDITNDQHIKFVRAGAEIYAIMFNIKSPKDQTQINNLIRMVYHKLAQTQRIRPIKQFSQQQKQARWAEEEKQEKNLINQLNKFKINPQQTLNLMQEMDLEGRLNWHIEFVQAAANLRAKNYRLGEASRFNIRTKLNKITPRVVTSACVITGAMGIETIKYLLKKPMQSFRELTANLSVPLLSMIELLPAKVTKDMQFDPIMCGPVKAIPKQFTKWEKIDIFQPMILYDFLEYVKKTYKIEQLYMINTGKEVIYSIWGDKVEMKRRLIMSIQDILCKCIKKPIFKWKKSVCLDLSGEQNGVDCIFPNVRYHFTKKI